MVLKSKYVCKMAALSRVLSVIVEPLEEGVVHGTYRVIVYV